MKNEKRLYSLSLLIFLGGIFYAYLSGTHAYINDSIVAIIVISIAYRLRRILNLTPLSLSLITLSFILHNCGVFGWYNVSPIGFQWDHVTHLVGFFTIGFLGMHYGQTLFTKKKSHNVMIVTILLRL